VVQSLIEAWAILQDSSKCKDDDRTALAALLKDIGLSEASDLEYIDANDIQRIAGINRHITFPFPEHVHLLLLGSYVSQILLSLYIATGMLRTVPAKKFSCFIAKR